MSRIIEPVKFSFISSFEPGKCGNFTLASDLIENLGKAGRDRASSFHCCDAFRE
jgi:hypothetical protein